MAKKMLIDATHPEETRVVVADGNKVEDFDFETISKKQIAGNIYLAKVTRVEPSLQAAFVEYGGNRHGFLAFSEIHPDYYQIPKADREALIAEEEEEARKRAAADEERRASRAAAAAARAEAKAARDAAREDDDEDDQDDGSDETDDEDDDYEAERPETVSEGEDESDESSDDDSDDEDEPQAEPEPEAKTEDAPEAPAETAAEAAPKAETAEDAPAEAPKAETAPETGETPAPETPAEDGAPESDVDSKEDSKDEDGSPRIMSEAAGAGDEDDERVEEDYAPSTRRPEDEAAKPETPAEASAEAVTEAPAETPAEEAAAEAPQAEDAAPAETAQAAPAEADAPAPAEETQAEPVSSEAETAREIVAEVFAETPAEPAAEPEAPVAEAPAETPAQAPVAEAAPAETAETAPSEAPAEEAVPAAEAEASREAETGEAETSESAESDDASGDNNDDASGDKRRRRSRRGGRSRRSRRSKARDDAGDDAPAEAKGDKDKGDAQPSVDDSSDDDASPSDARDDGDDLGEGISARRIFQRRYKIQEVIKVRQILLVQVVKEERGNKGAALTTYLSLAGRYCVLMPNTARGGGISRKITNAADRKKLKDIAGDIEVPRGMGLIIRTAGAKRTAQEIERDYEYLLRQWERIRETTLRSVAPTLIYEEGSLIKRAIRDLYAQGIDQICVDGDEGFKEAKDYMSMLMPGHARNVVRHQDPQPLFAKHGVEQELASMFNPTVQLKSGGYIVIGVTEALVAIDINSGKSTKEGSIEDTALKTNLEAAEEIARQLRLRDLAGLIVIDFIDMEDPRNNRSVEKRMKEKLKVDRARIQVGRISAFGLMEMSRQRLRPGVLEATTAPCAHCHGTGVVRADSSLALSILRQLEGEAARGRAPELAVRAPMGTASYLLNDKRDHLSGIECRHGVVIRVEGDPSLFSPEFHVDRIKTASRLPLQGMVPAMDAPDLEEVEEAEVVETAEELPDSVSEAPVEEARAPRSDNTPQSKPEAKDDDDGSRRRRGRRGGRRRKRGGDEEGAEEKAATPVSEEPAAQEEPSSPAQPATLMESDAPVEIPEPKRTRRRRKSKKAEEAVAEESSAAETPEEATAEPTAAEPEAAQATDTTPEASPAPAEAEATAEPEATPAPTETEAAAEPEAAPAPSEVAAPAEPELAMAAEPEAPAEQPAPAAEDATEEDAGETRPKKKGWWALRR